ncbi:hypothetical protein L228DRAFT_247430 [Xylona heveae TC161]|uniref:THIF-type NAD/FAD binding fold domain-containing protein n=1 Tax=Xylona heveae (strain CBS 132557 / TC161) TaxID=1328760 RepID=A0A165H4Y4_XYLHT|nr:hypothetical protein L228DRAFT_247430 [Xylona heveae TC161]KZF22989.1 hypothetical protein L228DRAFT_247430 [Xylona heveae TC161]
MSSFISRTSGSHQAQLAATAVISGALVASAIFGFQAARRKHRVDDLKASIPELSQEHVANKLTDFGAASQLGMSKEDERSAALAARAQKGDYDDDLILEQLARNRVFLTDEGLAKLRSSFIIVVGCGGVGSHATTNLARSGVSKIRLIDFDQVTLSSLNRHAVATLVDVGTPKVHTLQRRLQQVTPWVQFDCQNALFSESTAQSQLGPWSDGQQPSFVIDAIDNIDSKVALLHYCAKNSIPVISSMGAGCKSDPTRIFVGDIAASIEDPLSRSTRRRLRALGVKDGIPVVYSTEKPGPGKAQLLPLAEEEFQKGGVGELGVLPDFRVRILPVLGTMPAMFGLTAANHVILALTGYPHEYIPAKGREKLYDSILGTLQGLEERVARSYGLDVVGLKLPISQDDVGYLVEEVFKGRSAVSGLATRLNLVRWRAPASKEDMVDDRWPGQKSSRLNLTDLVCVTKEEAAVHEREILKGSKQPEDIYDPAVIDLVEARIKEDAVYRKYR